jgi:hypothetical protein
VSKHNTQEDCWLVIGNDKTGTSFLHLVTVSVSVKVAIPLSAAADTIFVPSFVPCLVLF